MLFIRLFLAALGCALAAMCVWAAMTGHFLDEFGIVGGLAWGKVSLVDIYLGFALFAVIIALMEPIRWSIPLIVLMFFLGNIVSAFWLAIRLPSIFRRLRPGSSA